MYAPLNKKCATEAAHEKCMTPIAATQLNILQTRNKEYAFLPKGINTFSPEKDIFYSITSQKYYIINLIKLQPLFFIKGASSTTPP